MPNWIEGSLKLRGTNKSLQRFCKEGLTNPGGHYGNKGPFVICSDDNCTFEVEICADTYVKDTSRAFISDEAYLYWPSDSNTMRTVCLPVKQAWGFDAGEWLEIANKYDLDIKLWGVECGIEFTQEIEIVKLEDSDEARVITQNITKTYDDWLWDCPMPLLGG